MKNEKAYVTLDKDTFWRDFNPVGTIWQLGVFIVMTKKQKNYLKKCNLSC